MENISITYNTDQDQESRKKGLFWTVCIHLLLLLIVMLPLIQIPQQNTDLYQGILVAFGDPDQGSDPDGQASAPAATSAESKQRDTSSPAEAPQPSPVDAIEPEADVAPSERAQAKFVQVVETQDMSPVVIPDQEAPNPTEQITSDINSDIDTRADNTLAEVEQEKENARIEAEKKEQQRSKEIAKQEANTKQEAEQKRKVEEQQRLKQQRLEAERQKAEAKRLEEEKKAQEAEELAEKKKLFGDGFSDAVPGNNDAAGQQGDPNGKIDADYRLGQAQGAGEVGAGLSNRGVVHTPKILDQSQKTGTVVVTVCVDEQGQVISAHYTQKGSTTVDANLMSIAVQGARKYKFTPSDIEEQCGTITIHFKVQ